MSLWAVILTSPRFSKLGLKLCCAAVVWMKEKTRWTVSDALPMSTVSSEQARSNTGVFWLRVQGTALVLPSVMRWVTSCMVALWSTGERYSESGEPYLMLERAVWVVVGWPVDRTWSCGLEYKCSTILAKSCCASSLLRDAVVACGWISSTPFPR